jgi:hypothetical protein
LPQQKFQPPLDQITLAELLVIGFAQSHIFISANDDERLPPSLRQAELWRMGLPSPFGILLFRND